MSASQGRDKYPPLPNIIIDTRERKPYIFGLKSIKKGLKTGDYSLEGYEDRIVVERKGRADIESCWHKARFKRELERLSEIPHSFLILECFNTSSFDMPLEHFIWSTSLHYNVKTYCVSNRRKGKECVEYLLTKFWEYENKRTLYTA